MIDQLDFNTVRERYERRENTHLQLRREFNEGIGNADTYVNLALGITNIHANYSASEHNLGPMVLDSIDNNVGQVFRLAQRLNDCIKNQIPGIINSYNIKYLKISVGSEMAMMLRPDEFWVGNRRTYWTYMLVRNNWNRNPANEALRHFRFNERDAEIGYEVWQYLYLNIEENLIEVANRGNDQARLQGVEPGTLTFLWADAIATSLYEIRG